jgi:hypothetical protein
LLISLEKAQIETASPAGGFFKTNWRNTAMKSKSISIATGLLAFALATQGLAAPPEGKGGGNDGGGKTKETNSGGDGSRTPNPITMSIAFRDSLTDGIRSAETAGQSSVYEGFDPDGMRAHIDGDSGGNYGNLYLYMEPLDGYSVFLDLVNNCVADCESLPFTARSFDRVGIKVIASESVSGGVCGMQPGDVITARMNVKFHDEIVYGTAAPGVIAYDTHGRRKHPCYQATSMVRVERGAAGTENEHTWTVSGDAAPACVNAPDGAHGGIVLLPFEMSATVIDPANPQEPACE